MANCLVGTNGTAGFSLISEFTGVSYGLDHDILLFQLLPSKYRNVKIYRYIQSSWQSLKNFWNNTFLVDREKIQTEIRITGQRMILEAWLRVVYGNCSINIVNQAAELDLIYLYRNGETGDILDDTFIFRQSEYGTNGTAGFPNTADDQEYVLTRSEAIPDVDFIVEIPSLVINSGISSNEIEAIVDRYKFMGTTYKIEIT